MFIQNLYKVLLIVNFFFLYSGKRIHCKMDYGKWVWLRQRTRRFWGHFRGCQTKLISLMACRGKKKKNRNRKIKKTIILFLIIFHTHLHLSNESRMVNHVLAKFKKKFLNFKNRLDFCK